MGKVITVKAETIEEAVRLGVSILGVELEEVEIEVLSNPGRSLFGLRKNMAEVCVTIKKNELPRQLEEMQKLEEFVESLADGPQKNSPSREKVFDSELVENETGARIINNKIELSFFGENYPVIEPKPNVRLFVNKEKVKKRVIIKPADEVCVKVSDELTPPFYSIKLIEQDMLAVISYSPGKKVNRMLENTEYKNVLKIEAVEDIEYYNDINPQVIVDELRSLGVQKGLIFPAIKNITEAVVKTKDVIAKGVQPIEGHDGDIVIHVGFGEEPVDELSTIDYREKSEILTIIAGGLIATRIPATPGKDGYTLLGKVIPAKKVKEIIVHTGKNVEMINDDIVAMIAGKPLIERRNKYIKIDVYKELVHKGEVDLKSGNIRFEGDLRISGNIHPSMYVSASGSIYIGGSISKATVQSAKAITVAGNVFTSTISVGKQNRVLVELADNLGEILNYLEQLRDAVRQVLLVRGEANEDLTTAELNHLIRLLLEKRYTAFQELNKHFIQKVKNHSMELPTEWVELANEIYGIFIHTLSEKLKDAVGLDILIEKARLLVELYSEEPEPKSILSVPYAINSELYCSGNIAITSKGLYHSFVTAGHNISVNGVCRGGEIFAENQVILHESGSKNMVKTVVRTGVKGSIRIGYAYAGTEVYVGAKGYVFQSDKSNVYVKLDENADLSVG